MNMKQDVTAIAELFVEARPSFKDVNPDIWLRNAILWAWLNDMIETSECIKMFNELPISNFTGHWQ